MTSPFGLPYISPSGYPLTKKEKLAKLGKEISSLLAEIQAGEAKERGAIPMVTVGSDDTENTDCDSADNSCEFETCNKEPSE